MSRRKRIRIKICGVRDATTACAALDAGADAVGLIFAPGSVRQVTLDEARAVTQALPPLIQSVGVFVDLPVAQIRDIAQQLHLSAVQLHGNESPEDVKELAPLRVIKALSLSLEDGRQVLEHWSEHAPDNLAGVLIDAPPPPDRAHEKVTGGYGNKADWAQLSQLRQQIGHKVPPLILAGGLTPDNVAEAIRMVQPYAVDVSSGVESARGVKDIGLIQAFCRAVREAEASTVTCRQDATGG